MPLLITRHNSEVKCGEHVLLFWINLDMNKLALRPAWFFANLIVKVDDVPGSCTRSAGIKKSFQFKPFQELSIKITAAETLVLHQLEMERNGSFYSFDDILT
jgi:hypothetical protein